MSDSRLAWAVTLTLLLFLAAVTAGWAGTRQNPQAGEDLMKIFEKEVAGQISGKPGPEIFARLFFNNLEACILLFLGGASFGIVTISILCLNGIVIGSILEIVQRNHPIIFVAAAIVPHGIFEIPAFILSGSIGILLAWSLLNEWHSGGDAADEAGRYGRIFLLVVVPLIFIAAFIEAFITPVVIHLVS